MIYLVRHAQAGSRSRWDGDDLDRPLTREGRHQAAEIATTLSTPELAVQRVLTSPYRRCIETVAPLAAALGLDVAVEAALAEGSTRDAVVLVRALAGCAAVLCSHGDVIPEILSTLAREDGLDLGRTPRCQKGSTWMLEPAVGGQSFVAARYLPSPTWVP